MSKRSPKQTHSSQPEAVPTVPGPDLTVPGGDQPEQLWGCSDLVWVPPWQLCYLCACVGRNSWDSQVSGIPWGSRDSLGFLVSPGSVSPVPSPAPGASAEPTFADPPFPPSHPISPPEPLSSSQTSLAGSHETFPISSLHSWIWGGRCHPAAPAQHPEEDVLPHLPGTHGCTGQQGQSRTRWVTRVTRAWHSWVGGQGTTSAP